MENADAILLEARGLTVEVPGLPGERHIGLRRVDLQLAKGEILVLAGEAASGPSLLARLVAGLADPRTKLLSGDLLLGGESLFGKGRRNELQLRRDRIAFLPGESAAPCEPGRTVGDWLRDCLRRPKTTPPSFADCCFNAGLLEPERLLERRLEDLSPLTRRRLGVTRALLRGAELLVSEAASADLDPLGADLYHGVLARLRDEQGLGILVATDTLRGTERFADRVGVFFDGGLLECGRTETLLTTPRYRYTSEFRDCSLSASKTPRAFPIIGREALREAEEAVHSG